MVLKELDNAAGFPAMRVVLPTYTVAQSLALIAKFLANNGFRHTHDVLGYESKYREVALTNSAALSKVKSRRHWSHRLPW